MSYICGMKNPFDKSVYQQRSKPIADDVRGAFFRDQTAIIHSLPFRRLKHKTQVFFAPENDHVCTRIEHVMHVATIATTICKGLNAAGWDLDVEMAFAIGLGHDLGHAPFGHDGEMILDQIMGNDSHFIHEINSYRVVQYLANKGKGLNLTYGVKDGIICHNGEKFEQFLQPEPKIKNLDEVKDRSMQPASYEGCIMRFSDKIAYLGRDIEDAITAGLLKRTDLPEKIREGVGDTNSQIIDTLVNDIINTSEESETICFSDSIYDVLVDFKNFNYENIYHNSKRMDTKPYAVKILRALFDYLMELIEKNRFDFPKYRESKTQLNWEFGDYLSDMYEFYSQQTDYKTIVCDYVAGMTDLYAISSMKQITFPPSLFVKIPHSF